MLTTLDERDCKAGLAEVIKYGVIWDPRFFSFLEENSSKLLAPGDALVNAIVRSCEIKAEVVGSDEREEGIRSILNFGHTFGHAIEAVSGYGAYRHGEAVAIGMAMAAAFSARLGMCKDCEPRITALLNSLGLPSSPPAIAPQDFIDAMRLDKKVLGRQIRFVLAEEIGKVCLKEAGEDELTGYLSSFAK